MKRNIPYKVFLGSALLVSISSTALGAPVLSEPGEQLPRTSEASQTPNIENTPHEAHGTYEEQQQIPFTLNDIIIETGEVGLDPAILKEQIKEYIGKPITFKDINKAAGIISSYARQHGYPAATAYIPKQKVQNQVLVLRMVPGRYGRILIDNQSQLRSEVVEGLSHGLKPGTIIRTDSLERVLYNVNDVGGIQAAGVLSPGTEVGTSDLTIRLKDGRRTMTALYSENYGSTSTGRYRYSLQNNWRNVSGQGDNLNVGILISNKEMKNYYMNYSSLAGHDGTTLGFSVSRLNYDLGRTELDSSGQADTLRLFGHTPLRRSAGHRLDLSYGFDYRALEDDIDFFKLNLSGQKHEYAINLGVHGMDRQGKALLDYSLVVESGTIVPDSAFGRVMVQKKNSEGRYTKAELNLNYIQGFDRYWDIMLRVQGQRASRNLDTSEGIYLGGANAVRAYPQSECSGDEGYVASMELRYHTKCQGLVLSTYLDTGHVNVRRDGSSGGRTLTGWGLGISYTKPQDWFARFDYARRIGFDEHASAEAKSKDRMWFLIGKIW